MFHTSSRPIKSKSKSKIHKRTRRSGPGHAPSTATGQPLATGTTSTRAPTHTRPPRDFQGLHRHTAKQTEQPHSRRQAHRLEATLARDTPQPPHRSARAHALAAHPSTHPPQQHTGESRSSHQPGATPAAGLLRRHTRAAGRGLTSTRTAEDVPHHPTSPPSPLLTHLSSPHSPRRS